jgi:hypothetical protein
VTSNAHALINAINSIFPLILVRIFLIRTTNRTNYTRKTTSQAYLRPGQPKKDIVDIHFLVKDSRATLLATEGAYGAQEQPYKKFTPVYFPGEYINQEVDQYEILLFGASINPERKKCVRRLLD